MAYLMENEDALAVQDQEEIQQRQEAESLCEQAGSAYSLFRDPTGSVDVNLQTAEVFLYGRMMVPVDAKIAQFPDFQDVFGTTELPLCAVVARNKHRDRWVRIYSGGYEYDVQAWKVATRSFLDDLPASRLKQINDGVTAVRAAFNASGGGAVGAGGGAGAGAEAGPTTTSRNIPDGHGDGDVPMWHNMPLHFGDRVEYWGANYVPCKTKGTLGWLSEGVDIIIGGSYVAELCRRSLFAKRSRPLAGCCCAMSCLRLEAEVWCSVATADVLGFKPATAEASAEETKTGVDAPAPAPAPASHVPGAPGAGGAGGAGAAAGGPVHPYGYERD